MRYRSSTVLSLVGVLLVAACSADSSDEPQDHSTTSVSSTVPATLDDTNAVPIEGDEPMVDAPLPTTPPLSTDRTHDGDTYPTELTGLVTGAVADLAERLNVDSDAIAVGAVEEVTWPNAGLGCPRSDMRYAQVTVDGLRIVLVRDDIEYNYHSGGSVEPFLCLPDTAKDTRDAIAIPGGTLDGSDRTVGGILKPVTPEAPKDSAPTDQAGGPGGQPND